MTDVFKMHFEIINRRSYKFKLLPYALYLSFRHFIIFQYIYC